MTSPVSRWRGDLESAPVSWGEEDSVKLGFSKRHLDSEIVIYKGSCAPPTPQMSLMKQGNGKHSRTVSAVFNQ